VATTLVMIPLPAMTLVGSVIKDLSFILWVSYLAFLVSSEMWPAASQPELIRLVKTLQGKL
jgi:hypothetical protein